MLEINRFTFHLGFNVDEALWKGFTKVLLERIAAINSALLFQELVLVDMAGYSEIIRVCFQLLLGFQGASVITDCPGILNVGKVYSPFTFRKGFQTREWEEVTRNTLQYNTLRLQINAQRFESLVL